MSGHQLPSSPLSSQPRPGSSSGLVAQVSLAVVISLSILTQLKSRSVVSQLGPKKFGSPSQDGEDAFVCAGSSRAV